MRYFYGILATSVIAISIYVFSITGSSQSKSLSIHLAYPIYSLKPHQADDWSSFFVINHIYPRFNSRIGEYRANSIFDKKEVVCSEDKIPAFSKDCQKVRVLFKVKSDLKSCDGKTYSQKDFDVELSEIIKAKNWIFPNFKFCGDGCFEFSNVTNIQDRFDSIYLRFGWSQNDPKAKSFGIIPNCFNVKTSEKGIISEGELKTPHANVILSQQDSKIYDIILYGNKPESSTYKSLNFYNPIYFYLLTTKYLKKESIEAVQDIILKNGIINQKTQAAPTYKNITNNRNTFEIKLPDYLEGCSELSKNLEKQINGLKFSCTNISVFTEQKVKKGLPWDGFISPLTPGMPGKNGINDQYFNKDSTDNWLGPNPERTTVILLGTLSGVMQVKKGKFCSIKPNSLGLSDITIDDFVECK